MMMTMMMMRLIAYHRFNIWCQMRIAWLVNIKNVPNKSEPTPNTNNQMLRLHVSAWVIKLVCSPCSSPFCCLKFTTLYIINVIVMDIGSIYPRPKHTPGPRVWYGAGLDCNYSCIYVLALRFSLFFFFLGSAHNSDFVSCEQCICTRFTVTQITLSTTFLLKMGPTALFPYLKIISLQCF